MDKSRRGFFSKLIGATAATVVVAPAAEPIVNPDAFERDGWKYRWTGWKTRADGLFEVGQWLAERLTPIGGDVCWAYRNNAYWCTTGCGDWYNKGDCFNLSLTQSGHQIDVDSTPQQRESAKHWAFAALQDFLEIEGKITDIPRPPFVGAVGN